MLPMVKGTKCQFHTDGCIGFDGYGENDRASGGHRMVGNDSIACELLLFFVGVNARNADTIKAGNFGLLSLTLF